MPHHLSLSFALLAALAAAGPLAAQEGDQGKTPAVTTPALKFGVFHDLGYKEALTRAAKDDKLVMLDFTTSWCGWCRKLEKDTFSQESVQKFLGEKAIPIQVDGDVQKDLVRKYRVQGYPTLVFVNADGDEVGRIVGYRTPDMFLAAARQETGRKGGGR